MKKILLSILLIHSSCNFTNNNSTDSESKATWISSLQYPQEIHLKNIKQLTFGGDNAEAYFSFDDSKLVFQSNYKDWGLECDQIFMKNVKKAANSVPCLL